MKLNLRSLLARILWWHSIAVLVTAVAVSAVVYFFLDSTADRLQQQTLRLHAERLRDDLTFAPNGGLHRRYGAADIPTYESTRLFSFIVLNPRGTPLLASVPRMVPAVGRIPRRAAPAYFASRSRTAIYSGYSLPAQVEGRKLWVVAVENLEHPDYIVDDILSQFLLYGLAFILPLLLLLLAMDSLIIRHALRPVRRASDLVRTLDSQRLEIRIPEKGLPSEVQPLASAVNAAFDRVIASYRTQRDFTADAAHELRTPIAIARMRIDAVSDEVLRSALKSDLDHLGHIVNQLLQIAELDSETLAADDRVDLHAVAADRIASIVPLAFREGKTISLIGTKRPVMVRGSAEMIARALDGLMENAVRHTPPGTSITVDCTPDGTLRVRDDGPGIPEDQQDLVFRRFWRHDRNAATNTGLGLAIVSRIAQAHGAKIALRSQAGDTVFSIRFTTDNRSDA